MQYPHHIPDSAIRRRLSSLSSYPKALMAPYIPDWAFFANQRLGVIEYENSSRGLLTHSAKYLLLADAFPTCHYRVVLVESLNHSAEHKMDRRLAWAVLRRRPSNLEVEIRPCTGEFQTLLDLGEELVDWALRV